MPCRAADIKPDDHVLEIGCGWGGFAKYVTSTIGAKVTGITISREQHAFAREAFMRPGLPTVQMSAGRLP